MPNRLGGFKGGVFTFKSLIREHKGVRVELANVDPTNLDRCSASSG